MHVLLTKHVVGLGWYFIGIPTKPEPYDRPIDPDILARAKAIAEKVRKDAVVS